MHPMKQLGLVVLLIVSVTLLATTPARGKDYKGETSGPIELANVGDEPQASGVASLTDIQIVSQSDPYDIWSGYVWRTYSATLSVNCENLTPRAKYSTPAGTIVASPKGKGSVSGTISFTLVWEVIFWNENNWYVGELVTPYVVDVVRLNPDGSNTPVLVGVYPPPYMP